MADEPCLQLTVVDTVVKLDTVGGYVFLCFIGCLLLGIVIALLIARCILRELEEHNCKQRQKSCSSPIIIADIDEEPRNRGMTVKMGSNRIAPMPAEDGPNNKSKSVAIEMTSGSFGRSNASLGNNTVSDSATQNEWSVIVALTKSSSEEMELVLQSQDFRSVTEMEKNLREHKSETFLQLLKLIFSFLLSKSRITEFFKREMITKYEQSIEDIESNSKRDKAEEEYELRSAISDPAELDDALELLHSKYTKRMNSELFELQNQVGKDLSSEDIGLSPEETEQIVEKIMSNLAATDRRLAEEAQRQSLILHEKLAQRQALAQLRAADNQEEKEEFEIRKRKPLKDLQLLTKRGKLLPEQKERIMEQYEEDLRVLEEKHQQAVLKHQAELSERLKRRREQRMKKLSIQQEAEREEFEQKGGLMIAEGSVTVEDYLEAQYKLMVEHQMVKEEEEKRADEKEAEELDNLREQLEQKRNKALEKKESSLFDEIKSQAHLTSNEADRLMRKHQEDLQALSEKKTKDKENHRQQMEEKLAERRQRWVREVEIQKAQQEQLITKQEMTINQVLKTQVGLTEDFRKQVMLEHEQNLMALNNHLQISKLRQQKKLEERLAKRRARLAELRQTMEDERSKAVEDDPDALKALSRAQDIEYQAEVRKMEEDHKAALEALRRRLAQETEEALKVQDERFGKILGKLQIDVARRQEIIQRQNEAIKTLEKNFVETMTKEGTLADVQTDRILRQHQKQVDKLNEKIDREKEEQMRKIREKLEIKQLKKERALEAQHAKELDEAKGKAVRSASSTMFNVLAEQRFRKQRQDLEHEMEVELARQVNQLKREMDEQLVLQMQEEEKNFMTNLVEVSKVSEEEFLKTLKTSASEAGLDARLTKNIAKDVRKRVRSSKAPPPDV